MGGWCTAMIVPCGAGVQYFAGLEPPTRHTWVIPHYVRPYELDQLRSEFHTLDAVLYVDQAGRPADLAELLQPVFGAGITADLVARHESTVRFGRGQTLFRLRR